MGSPAPVRASACKRLTSLPPFLYGGGNEGDKGIMLPSRETRPLDDTKTQPFKRISASAMPRLVHPSVQASRRRLHPGRRPRTAAGIALPSARAALSSEDRRLLSSLFETAASIGVDASLLNSTRMFRRLVRKLGRPDMPDRSARRWMHRLGLPSGGHRPAAVPDRTTAETA